MGWTQDRLQAKGLSTVRRQVASPGPWAEPGSPGQRHGHPSHYAPVGCPSSRTLRVGGSSASPSGTKGHRTQTQRGHTRAQSPERHPRTRTCPSVPSPHQRRHAGGQCQSGGHHAEHCSAGCRAVSLWGSPWGLFTLINISPSPPGIQGRALLHGTPGAGQCEGAG